MASLFGNRVARRRSGACVAMALTVALACGACSSGSSAKATGATTDRSSTSRGGSGTGGATELPDPCALVTNALVSELLGGPATKPKAKTVGAGSRACTWQLQATVDNPDPSTIGHMLELVVHASPIPSQTPEQVFDELEKSATEKAAVCEKSFWTEQGLNALQNGVHLSTMAALGSDDPSAKAAQERLMTAACKAVG